MPPARGTRLELTPARKLVIEMLHHARKVPSIPVSRALNVARVAGLREAIPSPPSWTAIFLKAYGLVCGRLPELRRAYVRWPRPHLYQHPFSIGSVIVERQVDDEAALLAAKVRAPEEHSLAAVQGHLHRFKHAPVWDVSDFRQLLRLARLPGPLRRFLFWHSLNWSGAKRAKRFGTFLVSSYGSLGAEQDHPLCPLTTLLTFGPVGTDGDVVVRLVYDHRVTDGRVIARALAELDRVLREEVADELELSAACGTHV
jgi:hypothetical protein